MGGVKCEVGVVKGGVGGSKVNGRNTGSQSYLTQPIYRAGTCRAGSLKVPLTRSVRGQIGGRRDRG